MKSKIFMYTNYRSNKNKPKVIKHSTDDEELPFFWLEMM